MSLSSTEELAREGKLYPSVILHGGDDDYRRQVALRLSQILLCEREPKERPCGSCRNCSRMSLSGHGSEAFHPDFSVLERDLKTVTSVDATKSFLRVAHVAPFEARGQVFVVANAETLGGGAANALLKTLEEPPERSPRHFLLLAPSQFDLLPTVRSRSLSVFLGISDSFNAAEVKDLSRSFSATVSDFAESRDPIHLLAAAEQLSAAGNWQDIRSMQPWTLMAAAVRQSLDTTPSSIDRRRILSLAEDLLGGWQLRLRGIQAHRIIEGLVVRNLSATV